MSMTEAPNEREAQIRGRVKMQFLRGCISIPEGSPLGDMRMLPGLQVDPELVKKGDYSLSTVSGADVKLFAEKIMRGIAYLEYELFIEKDQEIRLFTEPQDFIESYADSLLTMPGLSVSFGVLPSAEMPAILFIIRLWQQLTIYAAIMPDKDQTWHDRVLGLTAVTPLWEIEL